MISLTSLWLFQLSTMASSFFAPSPAISVKRSGWLSRISRDFSPKRATILLARAGPMFFTMPEARYFSIPSIVVGVSGRASSAWNWRPNLG